MIGDCLVRFARAVKRWRFRRANRRSRNNPATEITSIGMTFPEATRRRRKKMLAHEAAGHVH